MISNKKYYNISEVSHMLGLEEHKIRYWDSIDPKTHKNRIDGLSIKSKGGTRYFNLENIKKLKKIKELLYDGNNKNYSIKLVNKILLNKNTSYFKKNNDINYDNLSIENSKKIIQILNKMRILLNSDDNHLN